MKTENNWKHKTLENLEKDIWPSLNSSEESFLIRTCNALRKKQLKDFSIEDVRLMIGQDIGLKFLIPMAIEILKDNILAEGGLYEGDLLKSVLTSDRKYWIDFVENWRSICGIVEKNEKILKEFNTTWEIRKGWFDSYKQFKQICT